MMAPDFWEDSEAAYQQVRTYGHWKQHDELLRQADAHLRETQALQEIATELDLSTEYTELFEEWEQTNRACLLALNMQRLQLQWLPEDNWNVILEVRNLAPDWETYDLTRRWIQSLERYTQSKRWTLLTIYEIQEGLHSPYSHSIFHISGEKVYGHLRPFQGRYRLHIPKQPTEPTQPSVVREIDIRILPIPAPSLPLNPKELHIETFRHIGHSCHSTALPAMRITHIPSGIQTTIIHLYSHDSAKKSAMAHLQAELWASQQIQEMPKPPHFSPKHWAVSWVYQTLQSPEGTNLPMSLFLEGDWDVLHCIQQNLWFSST